jgi:Flp pilus assembly pilin Flp
MILTTTVRRIDAGSRIGAADVRAVLEERVAALRARSERGAQAAEYAMLGGVSAAACTGLVALFKNRDTLRALVDTVVGTLGRVIEGWF